MNSTNLIILLNDISWQNFFQFSSRHENPEIFWIRNFCSNLKSRPESGINLHPSNGQKVIKNSEFLDLGSGVATGKGGTKGTGTPS